MDGRPDDVIAIMGMLLPLPRPADRCSVSVGRPVDSPRDASLILK